MIDQEEYKFAALLQEDILRRIHTEGDNSKNHSIHEKTFLPDHHTEDYLLHQNQESLLFHYPCSYQERV